MQSFLGSLRLFPLPFRLLPLSLCPLVQRIICQPLLLPFPVFQFAEASGLAVDSHVCINAEAHRQLPSSNIQAGHQQSCQGSLTIGAAARVVLVASATRPDRNRSNGLRYWWDRCILASVPLVRAPVRFAFVPNGGVLCSHINRDSCYPFQDGSIANLCPLRASFHTAVMAYCRSVRPIRAQFLDFAAGNVALLGRFRSYYKDVANSVAHQPVVRAFTFALRMRLAWHVQHLPPAQAAAVLRQRGWLQGIRDMANGLDSSLSIADWGFLDLGIGI